MPRDNDSGYFGVRLGDAIATGAGHISEALQRKYAMQRRDEEMARQREEEKAAQNQATRMSFAKQGINYNPEDPASLAEAFAEFSKLGKTNRAQDEQFRAAQIGALNAKATPGATYEPPPGYRGTPSGLEPIPGGPAAVKAQEAQAKKAASIQTQKVRNEEVLSTVNDVIGKVGIFTAGPLGNALSSIGGTSAANLEGDIKTIQANLGFDRLSQMRAESPTGGALGQVSDRELALLTSAVANLGQKLSPSKLKENLEKVRTHLLNWQAAVDKAATESPEPGAGGGIQIKTLKDGTQVRVRRAADGSWEEVE